MTIRITIKKPERITPRIGRVYLSHQGNVYLGTRTPHKSWISDEADTLILLGTDHERDRSGYFPVDAANVVLVTDLGKLEVHRE